MNPLLRTLGGQVARQAARKHVGAGAALDPKRGWAMMRDRQVPAGTKALALGLGVAVTAGFVALEVPMESVVGFFLPVIGVVTDTLIDGAEMILGPLLFASMFLPHLIAAAERRSQALQPAPMARQPRR